MSFVIQKHRLRPLNATCLPTGGYVAVRKITTKRIKDYFGQDALAAHLGIELLDVSPGKAVARMQLRDHHLNSLGTVHGGAIFALADFAFAAASNSHGTVAVALNATISFVKAASTGVLTAEAAEISVSRKIGTYTVNVTDESGQIVAVFQGMAYRKGKPIAADD